MVHEVAENCGEEEEEGEMVEAGKGEDFLHPGIGGMDNHLSVEHLDGDEEVG